jgi:hypothetical protein
MTSAANISMLRLTRSSGITPNCRMHTGMFESDALAYAGDVLAYRQRTTDHNGNAAVDIWPYADALDLTNAASRYVCRVPTVVLITC